MKQQRLALWPLLLPKLRSKRRAHLRVERIEWNQESEKHQVSFEEQELTLERFERLVASFGEYKKLVL